MENKNQKIGLIIILSTVLFLAIILIGMTYAYFTAVNNERSGSSIVAVGGKMLINYDDGTDDIVPVTNIKPSNAILVDKTFTLTGTNTTVGINTDDGLPMPYKVGVRYTSTFSDGMIHYYIKEVERDTNSQVTANYVIKPETGKTENDYKNQTVPGNDTYTEYTHGTFKNGKKYTEMVTGEFPASLNDQTITFNLIMQFPDNNENQNSEKGKTFNGKVVVNYEPSFTEDSWSEIAANVKDNPAAYKVGDTKQVTIGGKSYTVRVANNTTPSDCNKVDFSQTACGFVVEFVDIVETKKMNPSGEHNGTNYPYGWNVGGWTGSEMRTFANEEFLKKLPSDLKNVIKATKVISGHGYSDNNTIRTDGNWESTDKIYLLSGHEVWEDVAPSTTSLSAIDTAYGQTRQLDYYKSKGVTTNSYSSAIKKYNGSTSLWWLRAANSSNGYSFLSVVGSGSWNSIYAYFANGFAPAFRIG